METISAGPSVHSASDNRYPVNLSAVGFGSIIDVDSAVARCDREIQAYESEVDKEAWLVTLGVEDWRMEQRLLLSRQSL